ncbi:MAG: hypothetical protein QOF09_680 [Alphaproteobacteria bacterium]|nr:hypothetical protein [Alphaproteobacteria bacterium]
MIGKIVRASVFAFVVAAPTFDTAAAGTAYDGSWSLTIVTQRGNCDQTYYFQVQVTNGIVSHPNLVRLRGRVSSKGVARVSVSVMDKHASGSGRLSRSSGSGRWSGHSGPDRCSGYWTAQRG